MLLLAPFFIVVITLLPLGVAVLLILNYRKKENERLHPLSKSIYRPPGYQLFKTIESEREKFNETFLLMIVAGPFVFSVLAAQWLFSESKINVISVVAFIIFLLFVTVWGSKKLLAYAKRLQALKLGYECELATGQELDQLMKFGFHVFHDVPAEGFNIDHLIVGPTGVFAVETKGRSKPKTEAGGEKSSYRVVYENGVLQFPTWQETEPLEQAKRQSQWVSKWLSNACGIQVNSSPVVIFPGWYIERKTRPEVPILALGGMSNFFIKYQVQPLQEAQIKQVVYQVEQKVKQLGVKDVTAV